MIGANLDSVAFGPAPPHPPAPDLRWLVSELAQFIQTNDLFPSCPLDLS